MERNALMDTKPDFALPQTSLAKTVAHDEGCTHPEGFRQKRKAALVEKTAIAPVLRVQ
jgi:hypothetical protein